MPEVYFSAQQAARLLGIGMTRFYRVVKAGDLTAVRLPQHGKRPLYKRSQIETYRERRDEWLRLHGRKRA